MAIEPTTSDVLKKVNTLTDEMHALTGKVDTLSETVGTVAEAVQTLAVHMDERFELLRTDVKNDIATEVDRFVSLYQKHDVEIVALRSRCDRIESAVGSG